MLGFKLENIQVYEEKSNMDIIKQIIKDNGENDEPFFTLDIENVVKNHRRLLTKMPRVIPHYGKNNNKNIYIFFINIETKIFNMFSILFFSCKM